MNTVKRIAFDGVGIALYVVVSLFLSFPIIQNWYLSLGYTVMVVFLYSIGMADGIIVGIFGTALYCLLVNMIWGMPGWIIGNIIICLILGAVLKRIGNVSDWKAGNYILLCVVMALSSVIGILLIKSWIESFYYGQTFVIRMGRNFGACIMDIIGLLLSVPVIAACGNKLKVIYTRK